MKEIKTIKRAIKVEKILYKITNTGSQGWHRKLTKKGNVIIYESDGEVDAYTEKEFIEYVNDWVKHLADFKYYIKYLEDAGLIKTK
jgi:hypothetical protein